MSLYLKYRPKDFSSLVGQEFVKETLKKAVADNKLVGAYLFCGPRGTGKTSSARIFSAAMNCLSNKNGDPCLECENCKSFLDGKLTDIIEIDAASHTGVDNIREEIIEKAIFQPNVAKYKVYIIDETHMLSKGAFNALLKILEEPPSHVKFILATTEVNKIPETILSRCQRYDFSKITKNDIKKRLEFIANEEGIKTEDEAIDYIIKNSDGGLRNAISLFEQFVIGDKLSFDYIKSNLGLVSSDKIEEITNKILAKNRNILHEIKEIGDSGVNMKLFFKDILFYLRDLLIEDFSNGNEKKEVLDLLNIMSESFVKSKNSFDEILPFFVGIVSFISGDNLVEEQSPKKEIQVETKKQTPLTPLIRGEQNNNSSPDKGRLGGVPKENVDLDDVFSVFGNEEAKTSPLAPLLTGEGNSKNSPGDFNLEALLLELKKESGKAFLSLSIKSSDVFLRGENLMIKTKTKFNFDKINTVDNISLLNQKLLDLGFNYRVKVEI